MGQHGESAMTLQFRVAGGRMNAMLLAAASAIRGLDSRVAVLRLSTWRQYLNDGLTV
jgi:hypothetical protein